MCNVIRWSVALVLVAAAARLSLGASPAETTPAPKPEVAPSNAPMTPEAMNAIAAQVLALQREDAQLEAKQKQATDPLWKKVSDLQAEQAKAQQAGNDARLKELAPALKEASDKYQQEQKAWMDKEQAFVDQHQAEQKSFAAMMNSFFKPAAESYPQLAKNRGNWRVEHALGQFIWQNDKGQEVVMATIHLYEKPAPNALAAMPKFAGRYPIQAQSDSYVYVWAGQIQVVLGTFLSKADAPEWRNKDKLLQGVQNLFDLAGMSKVDAK